MTRPEFEVGEKFLGVYVTKLYDRCAQCGDTVEPGTPVLQSIGKFKERVICPRCFNWLRQNLISECERLNPEPILDWYDWDKRKLPPNAVRTCPKCGGNEWHVTWQSYIEDRFLMDVHEGTPDYIGTGRPSQDPGTVIALQCERCLHVVYDRPYA